MRELCHGGVSICWVTVLALHGETALSDVENLEMMLLVDNLN
jgi:hypothetical protein